MEQQHSPTPPPKQNNCRHELPARTFRPLLRPNPLTLFLPHTLLLPDDWGAAYNKHFQDEEMRETWPDTLPYNKLGGDRSPDEGVEKADLTPLLMKKMLKFDTIRGRIVGKVGKVDNVDNVGNVDSVSEGRSGHVNGAKRTKEAEEAEEAEEAKEAEEAMEAEEAEEGREANRADRADRADSANEANETGQVGGVDKANGNGRETPVSPFRIHENLKSMFKGAPIILSENLGKRNNRGDSIVKRFAATIFLVVGVSVISLPPITARKQEKYCIDLVGACVWERTEPKLFFGNGLFAGGTCSFNRPEGVLDLSKCDPPLESLPHDLVHYTGIDEILASGNSIKEFPPLNFTVLFERLDLAGNDIVHFPLEVARSGTSCKIDLADNPTDEILTWASSELDVHNFPTNISSLLPNLEHLDLSGNNFTSEVFLFLSADAKLGGVKTLDLSANSISSIMDSCAEETVTVLYPNLNTLNVSHNREITTLEKEQFLPVDWKVDFSHCSISESPSVDASVSLQHHDLILNGNRVGFWGDDSFQTSCDVNSLSSCSHYDLIYDNGNLISKLDYFLENTDFDRGRGYFEHDEKSDDEQTFGRLSRIPSWHAHYDSVAFYKLANTGVSKIAVLPPDLEVLHISRNPALENITNVFDRLDKLEVVMLDKNTNLALLGDGIFGKNRRLKHVRIQDNAIEAFDASSLFSSDGELETLVLLNNDILELRPNTFAGGCCGSITHIDLEYNKIVELNAEVFNGLSSLTSLSLKGTGKAKIERIEGRAFEGLEKLEYLNLANNNITKLPENSFAGLPNLIGLELRGNKIDELEQGSFNGLASLEWIHLGEVTLREGEDLKKWEDHYAFLSGLDTIYVNGENLTSSNKIFEEFKTNLTVSRDGNKATIYASDSGYSRFKEEDIKIAFTNHILEQNSFSVYFDGNPEITYADAQSTCRNEGGHLVSITSQAEADLISRLISSYNDEDYQEDFSQYNYWIGADRSSSFGSTPNEGMWTDGSPWTFWNWDTYSNQPNGEKDVFDFDNVQYCGVESECCYRGGPNERHCFNPSDVEKRDESLVYISGCLDGNSEFSSSLCWNDEGKYESEERDIYAFGQSWDNPDKTDRLADHVVKARYICWIHCSTGSYKVGDGCQTCDYGFTTAEPDAESVEDCTVCDVGFYGDGSTCERCQKGNTTKIAGSTLVDDCTCEYELFNGFCLYPTERIMQGIVNYGKNSDVYLKGGEYTPYTFNHHHHSHSNNFELVFTEAISVLCADSDDQCVFDGDNKYRLIHTKGVSDGDARFVGLTVTKGYSFDKGGGLLVTERSSVVLDDCVFRLNRAQVDGGAMFVDGSSVVAIKHCVFVDNRATYGNGGALYVQESSYVIFYANSFSNNNAETGLGGDFYGHRSELVFQRCAAGYYNYEEGDALDGKGTDIFVNNEKWFHENDFMDMNTGLMISASYDYMNSGSCTPCPSGKFSFEGFATSCLDVCPVGSYISSSGRGCIQCPLHSSTPGPGSASSREECNVCDSGYFFDGSICRPCSASASTPGSADDLNVCISSCRTGFFGVDSVCRSCSFLKFTGWVRDGAHVPNSEIPRMIRTYLAVQLAPVYRTRHIVYEVDPSLADAEGWQYVDVVVPVNPVGGEKVEFWVHSKGPASVGVNSYAIYSRSTVTWKDVVLYHPDSTETRLEDIEIEEGSELSIGIELSQWAVSCESCYSGVTTQFDGSESYEQCAICAVGFYRNPTTGLCESCGGGTTASPGSTSVNDCICKVGFYLDLHEGRCVTCDASRATTASTGSTSLSDCLCYAGFYRDGNNGCVSCGEGTTLSAGSTSANDCICDSGAYLDREYPRLSGLTREWFAGDCSKATSDPRGWFRTDGVPRGGEDGGPMFFERVTIPPQPLDEHSFRFSGSFIPKESGTYRFVLISDDGSWLFIGGHMVVDNGGSHRQWKRTGSIELVENREYDVELLYGQGFYSGVLELQWKGGRVRDYTTDLRGYFFVSSKYHAWLDYEAEKVDRCVTCGFGRSTTTAWVPLAGVEQCQCEIGFYTSDMGCVDCGIGFVESHDNEVEPNNGCTCAAEVSDNIGGDGGGVCAVDTISLAEACEDFPNFDGELKANMKTLWLRSGTLTGPEVDNNNNNNNNVVAINRTIAIECVEEDNSCVLDGENERRVIEITNSTAEVDLTGLSIVRGYHTIGSGIYIYKSSLSLTKSIISACTSTAGGGGVYIKGQGSTIVIVNCVLKDNTATDGPGGAIYVDTEEGYKRNKMYDYVVVSSYGVEFSGNSAIVSTNGNDVYSTADGIIEVRDCGMGFSGGEEGVSLNIAGEGEFRGTLRSFTECALI